jgi:hypothetical protein
MGKLLGFKKPSTAVVADKSSVHVVLPEMPKTEGKKIDVKAEVKKIEVNTEVKPEVKAQDKAPSS